MNISYIEALIRFAEGIISALSFLVGAILLYYFYKSFIKYFRRGRNLLNSSRRLVVMEAEKRGIDLSPYADYDAEQLYQILEGLVSGIDVSKYCSTEYSAQDMFSKRIELEKRKAKELKVNLPSIEDLTQLGFKEKYLTIREDSNIEYHLNGPVCNIKLGNEFKTYTVHQFREGLYFHCEGLISFFKPND